MFLQTLTTYHRCYLRLFWQFSKDDHIKVLELDTVCFGIKSSRYLASKTLRQLAFNERDKYPRESVVVA